MVPFPTAATSPLRLLTQETLVHMSRQRRPAFPTAMPTLQCRRRNRRSNRSGEPCRMPGLRCTSLGSSDHHRGRHRSRQSVRLRIRVPMPQQPRRTMTELPLRRRHGMFRTLRFRSPVRPPRLDRSDRASARCWHPIEAPGAAAARQFLALLRQAFSQRPSHKLSSTLRWRTPSSRCPPAPRLCSAVASRQFHCHRGRSNGDRPS
mmetsp:Transcript_8197/g.25593  ORF Transcript_8197/g.25593 Transcript_8197/m.25593 type:complete len:205 (-) Transcript_8197:88-702(-)